MTAPPPAGSPEDQFTLNSNDRLLAALGYVFVVVAIVVAVLDETRRKPLLKDHAVQGIGFGVAAFIYSMLAGVIFVCATILTFGLLGLVLWVLFFVPLPVAVYFAYLAYTQDGLVEMPFLTDFMAQQGWLETRAPA